MSFLVIFWLGLGNPRHIATKSQHLWAVPRQIEFWSILKKSWDWVRSPPPSLGQIPNFYRKLVLRASLSSHVSSLTAYSQSARRQCYPLRRGWRQKIALLAALACARSCPYSAWSKCARPYWACWYSVRTWSNLEAFSLYLRPNLELDNGGWWVVFTFMFCLGLNRVGFKSEMP